MFFHFLLTLIVANKKSAVSLIFIPLVNNKCLPLCVLIRFFSLSLILSSFIMIFLGCFSPCFLCLEVVELLGCVGYSFHKIWKFFRHHFFQYFSVLCFFPSETLIIQRLGHMKLFTSHWCCVHFFFNILFFLLWLSIVNSFYCYLFKFTKIFFHSV